MRLALAAALAAVAATVPRPAGSQIIREPQPAASAPDTPSVAPTGLATADYARFEQRAFEVFRRGHLPFARSAASGSCDEKVGPICYWYDETPLPKEPAETTRHRTRLIAELDSLALVAPDNTWIAAQRVRYLAEAERFGDALAAARACTGPGAGGGWRCEILVGFSLHLLGDYAAAESVYDAAISHMGPKESCEWRDMSMLLDDVALAQYRELPCGDARRDAWAARTWFLARTLYSMKGNDSRTEYFARMTMVEMLRDAANPYQSGFDENDREVLLRFGWPRAWGANLVMPLTVAVVPPMPANPGTGGGGLSPRGKGRGVGGPGGPLGNLPPGTKVPPSVPVFVPPPEIPRTPAGVPGGGGNASPGLPRPPGVRIGAREGGAISVVGMEPVPAYRYIPPGFVLNNPPQADSAAWRLHLPPVIARYAPAYARTLVPLEHQKAVFRRADSALVVVAYETKGTPTVDGARIRAALVVTPAGALPRDYRAIRDSAPASGTLLVRAPWGPLLMSAEVAAPERNAVARARYGIGPTPGADVRVALSDILFFKPYGSVPASVEDVAPHALPTERVRSNEKLGVYWEAYRTDPSGEQMRVSVVVARESPPPEGGLMRRMAKALGLARELTPVSVSVSDLSARGTSTSTRAIELDISTLTKGAYIVQLELEVSGQPTLRAAHRIEVAN